MAKPLLDTTIDMIAEEETAAPSGSQQEEFCPREETYYSLGAPTYWVREDAGTVQICVNREGPDTGTSSVQYETEEGTAKDGRNYVSTRGILTFAPGEKQKNFSVHILPDDVTTTHETFTVKLTSLHSGMSKKERLCIYDSCTVIVHDSVSQSVAAVKLVYFSWPYQSFLIVAMVFGILMPPFQMLWVPVSGDAALQVVYTVLFAFFVVDILFHTYAQWPFGYLFTSTFFMDSVAIFGFLALLNWVADPIRDNRTLSGEESYLWETRRQTWGQIARTMKLGLLLGRFSGLTIRLVQWLLLHKRKTKRNMEVALQRLVSTTTMPMSPNPTFQRKPNFPLSLSQEDLTLEPETDPLSQEDNIDELLSLEAPTKLVENIVAQVIRIITLVVLAVVILTTRASDSADRGLLVLDLAYSSSTNESLLSAQIGVYAAPAVSFVDAQVAPKQVLLNESAFTSGSGLIFLKLGGDPITSFINQDRIRQRRQWSELKYTGYNRTESGYERCEIIPSIGILGTAQYCQTVSIFDISNKNHELASSFIYIALVLVALIAIGMVLMLMDIIGQRLNPMMRLAGRMTQFKQAFKDMYTEFAAFVKKQAKSSHARRSSFTVPPGSSQKAALQRFLSHNSTRGIAIKAEKLTKADGFSTLGALVHLQARFEVLFGRPVSLMVSTLQDIEVAFGLPLGMYRRLLLQFSNWMQTRWPTLEHLAAKLDLGILTKADIAAAAPMLTPNVNLFDVAPDSEYARFVYLTKMSIEMCVIGLSTVIESLERQVKENLHLHPQTEVTSGIVQTYALGQVRPRLKLRLEKVGANVPPNFENLWFSQLHMAIDDAMREVVAQKLDTVGLQTPRQFWNMDASEILESGELIVVKNALRRAKAAGADIPGYWLVCDTMAELRTAVDFHLTQNLYRKLVSAGRPPPKQVRSFQELAWLAVKDLATGPDGTCELAEVLFAVRTALDAAGELGNLSMLPQYPAVQQAVQKLLNKLIAGLKPESEQVKKLLRNSSEFVNSNVMVSSAALSQQGAVLSYIADAASTPSERDDAQHAACVLKQLGAIYTVVSECAAEPPPRIAATKRRLLQLDLHGLELPKSPLDEHLKAMGIPANFSSWISEDPALRQLVKMPVFLEAFILTSCRAVVRMGTVVELWGRLTQSRYFDSFWESFWDALW
eukprot:jgi/Chlat1/3112/Chrsp21S08799